MENKPEQQRWKLKQQFGATPAALLNFQWLLNLKQHTSMIVNRCVGSHHDEDLSSNRWLSSTDLIRFLLCWASNIDTGFLSYMDKAGEGCWLVRWVHIISVVYKECQGDSCSAFCVSHIARIRQVHLEEDTVWEWLRFIHWMSQRLCVC